MITTRLVSIVDAHKVYNNASSFRVTEENLVFEAVQSGPYSSLNVFTAL